MDASLSALTTCKEGSIKFVDFANNHDKATELKIKAAMDAINELNDAINEAKLQTLCRQPSRLSWCRLTGHTEELYVAP